MTRSDSPRTIKVTLASLGVASATLIKDIWTGATDRSGSTPQRRDVRWYSICSAIVSA
jgi:hypothetical protein